MQNKKWLTMLLALVISVVVWVYIVTVENPERQATLFNIPVTFSGEDILREDYSLIIAETNVESGVTLEFSGTQQAPGRQNGAGGDGGRLPAAERQ